MPTRQAKRGVRFTQDISAPPNPSLGDEWYNPTTNKLYRFANFNNTTQWAETPSFATVVLPSWTTATRPTTPAAGTLGLNTTTNVVEAFISNAWVAFPTS
jgi:hypothetical protein